MKRIVLILILCVAATLPLLAQESENETLPQQKEEPNKENYFEQYRMGLFWSSYKGSGIHVGIPIDERFNFGITGLIYFTKNGKEERTINSLGVSLSYDVFESINRRFYLSAGLGGNGETTKYSFSNETEKSSFRYGIAAGIGFAHQNRKGSTLCLMPDTIPFTGEA
jgi:hypothetical protein